MQRPLIISAEERISNAARDARRCCKPSDITDIQISVATYSPLCRNSALTYFLSRCTTQPLSDT